MRADDPLAANKTLTEFDLKDLPLAFFDRVLNPQLYHRVLPLLAIDGKAPKPLLETRQVSTALALVAPKDAYYQCPTTLYLHSQQIRSPFHLPERTSR